MMDGRGWGWGIKSTITGCVGRIALTGRCVGKFPLCGEGIKAKKEKESLKQPLNKSPSSPSATEEGRRPQEARALGISTHRGQIYMQIYPRGGPPHPVRAGMAAGGERRGLNYKQSPAGIGLGDWGTHSHED